MNALTEQDRQILRDQRTEFWRWVLRIAAGVIVGQLVTAGILYLILRGWVEANF